MDYVFPAIAKDRRARSFRGQAFKIAEEVEEVQQELNVPAGMEDLQAVAFEAANVYHAAETLLRMLEDQGVDVDVAMERTREANDARGYYGD